MSDRMRLIPFDKLIQWVFEEYQQDQSIFGIHRDKFYRKVSPNSFKLFGEMLENPLGPAAGPHTQLAQNIVAAYLCGSRFFELKTVQILDGEDLPVSKPCILAQDEGYNVEWSTELTVPDAFNEYVKAWFLLHLLSKELGLGSKGFVFNMSVGYDLAGIQSPKIDAFIEGLKDASQTPVWNECKGYILKHLDLFQNINRNDIETISPHICQSITLSTLHGCPPAEIERIAKYLLQQKKLHTFVKCNPTLLGYDFAKNTLNQMGYDYLAFDDHHFRNDLQFEDAVPMIARLKDFAHDLQLTFGVKLSNTFPVQIKNQELPGEEMYMSGRSLYPLTINLAYKLAAAFNGDLPISYSGGADAFNIDQIYQTGIWPITVATAVLKPGGYLRLAQMAELLDHSSTALAYPKIDLQKLKYLAENAMTDNHHLKESREIENRKIEKNLPLTDCFIAPCTEGCPIGQDVPEYIRLVGEGRYEEALKVITSKNPLPFITGTLCNHRCTTKCTRIDYEKAVDIRETKLVAAEKGYDELLKQIETPKICSNFKVAIIGAGPTGLAAAYFLGRAGVDVTVYDRKDKIGGIIEHIAPRFRISTEAVERDMELIRKAGVRFKLGVSGEFSITSLKKEGFKYIFIAIGAWKPGYLQLQSSDREIINVLEFLETYNKKQDHLKLGKNVAVIGAGNSAMDAARAAKRVPGVENVYIVYRRTRKYMPADREELHLALSEGIQFKELLAPVSFQEGVLKCQQMTLGAPDASGRRSPVAMTGEFVELEVDTIIAAVGEGVETDGLIANGIEVDTKGKVQVNSQNETNIANVFIGGDAFRGPATIVEGIADGIKFAETVLAREGQPPLNLDKSVSFDRKKQVESIVEKKGILVKNCCPGQEDQRCLECNTICNLCIEVCPNRANVAIYGKIGDLECRNQVIHMDGMCNECGNCKTFCPYDSAPYLDKLTLYWHQEDFEDNHNTGFLLVDEKTNRFRVRLGETILEITFDSNGNCGEKISKDIADLIWKTYKDYRYLFILHPAKYGSG